MAREGRGSRQACAGSEALVKAVKHGGWLNGDRSKGKSLGLEEELTTILIDEVRELGGGRMRRARRREEAAAAGNRLDAERTVRSCLIQGT